MAAVPLTSPMEQLQRLTDASSSASSTLAAGPISTGSITLAAAPAVSTSTGGLPPWLLLLGLVALVYLMGRR